MPGDLGILKKRWFVVAGLHRLVSRCRQHFSFDKANLISVLYPIGKASTFLLSSSIYCCRYTACSSVIASHSIFSSRTPIWTVISHQAYNRERFRDISYNQPEEIYSCVLLVKSHEDDMVVITTRPFRVYLSEIVVWRPLCELDALLSDHLYSGPFSYRLGYCLPVWPMSRFTSCTCPR